MTSPSGPANRQGIPDRDPRLIAVMPLHDITTLYGEPGLRARFAIEAGRLASPADRVRFRAEAEAAAAAGLSR